MKRYTLRVRNNAFRNNNIDDMGVSTITRDPEILIEEIKHTIELGNLDFEVDVDEIDED